MRGSFSFGPEPTGSRQIVPSACASLTQRRALRSVIDFQSPIAQWMINAGGILGFVTGCATILGWIASLLFPKPNTPRRRSPEREAGRSTSNQEPMQAEDEEDFSALGTARTALLNLILRPDIPLGQEVSKVLSLLVGLVVLSGMHAWNMSENASAQASTLPIFDILQDVAFYLLFANFVMAALWIARLFWKIRYLKGTRSPRW